MPIENSRNGLTQTNLPTRALLVYLKPSGPTGLLKGADVKLDNVKVGLTAFSDARWPSVSRTYDFYERSLRAAFDTEIIAQDDIVDRSRDLDVLVNFHGAAAWTRRAEIDCAVVYGMHGGLIVDRAFLVNHLGDCQSRDRFLINCTSDRAILAAASPAHASRADLLPLPVHARPRPDRAFCREVLDLPGDIAVIGFVARLLPAKNLHGFLEMLARIKTALAPKKVRAIVVGNYWADYPVLPFCTDGYQAVIKDSLARLGLEPDLMYFPAALPDEHLDMVYGALDLLVHPTYGIDENFGYVPIEAMAAGVPVVASAYGGVKDTVREGETGHLMPTWITAGGIRMDQETGIAAAVNLLSNDTVRHSFADAARTHAQTAYSEEICRAALIASVKAAAAPADDRAAVVTPWPNRDQRTILPEVSRGWDEFAPLVHYYVSTEPPDIAPGDRVYLPAVLAFEPDGIVGSTDPAWPAEAKLAPEAIAVLSDLRHGTSVPVTGTWPDRALAAALIADGWLVVQKGGQRLGQNAGQTR